MSKRGRWWILGCVGLVACGGKLVDGGAHASAGASSAGAGESSAGESSAGTPNAGVGNGGANAGNDGGGSAGEAGATAACLGDGYIACTDWCGRPAVEFTLGECQGGTWHCPAPLLDPESCPEESCVLQRVMCCDHEFGKNTFPDCAADGNFGPCPAGFERNAPVCVADSAHTTNCQSLIDRSCTLEDAMCEAGGAHCRCQPGDGGLTWSCVFDLL